MSLLGSQSVPGSPSPPGPFSSRTEREAVVGRGRFSRGRGKPRPPLGPPGAPWSPLTAGGEVQVGGGPSGNPDCPQHPQSTMVEGARLDAIKTSSTGLRGGEIARGADPTGMTRCSQLCPVLGWVRWGLSFLCVDFRSHPPLQAGAGCGLGVGNGLPPSLPRSVAASLGIQSWVRPGRLPSWCPVPEVRPHPATDPSPGSGTCLEGRFHPGQTVGSAARWLPRGSAGTFPGVLSPVELAPQLIPPTPCAPWLG